MSGQHARPHGLFDSKDAERVATPQERSALLPARRPLRRTLRRLLRGRRRAPLRRAASRHRKDGAVNSRAGSLLPVVYPSMLPLPLPPLLPLPRPRPPVDVGGPRAIPQVAALRVSIWLPTPGEPCQCGERWGRCLLAQVAEILHHPLVDLAIDSITMAVTP